MVELPSTTEKVIKQVLEEALLNKKSCDLSTVCPNCNTAMEPEHAHYRCPKCHYRDSCCF